MAQLKRPLGAFDLKSDAATETATADHFRTLRFPRALTIECRPTPPLCREQRRFAFASRARNAREIDPVVRFFNDMPFNIVMERIDERPNACFL
jgi:hypothetical protein